MTLRVCTKPNCPTLVKSGTCPAHTPTTKQRGYGTEHQRLRARYQRRMNEGQTFTCWRCGRPIDPTNWDLGHDDADREITRGPECPPCNRATTPRRIS